MNTVFDIASYILARCGPMTAMKLQKLVYYSQAWALVWLEKPLFADEIEAWANGPVVPSLYKAHKGMFEVAVGSLQGNPEAVAQAQQEAGAIEKVLSYYGDKPSQWLSDLTHAEQPWSDARKGLAPGERGNCVITKAAMSEYYGSL